MWQKVVLKRGQDSQNNFEQSRRRGQSSKSCNFLKCMKTVRKTVVFQGLERVRAPKLEPLGPQSRAREGSGQPKRRLKAQQEGSEQQKLGHRGGNVDLDSTRVTHIFAIWDDFQSLLGRFLRRFCRFWVLEPGLGAIWATRRKKV